MTIYQGFTPSCLHTLSAALLIKKYFLCQEENDGGKSQGNTPFQDLTLISRNDKQRTCKQTRCFDHDWQEQIEVSEKLLYFYEPFQNPLKMHFKLYFEQPSSKVGKFKIDVHF